MKVIIPKLKLSKALAMVKKAAEKRNAMPVLSHVKMSLAGRVLLLTCTDIETMVTVRIKDVDGEGGTALLPCADLAKSILTMTGDITIDVKDGWATISDSIGKMRLAGMPAEEFPAPVEINGIKHEMPVLDLEEDINSVLYAAGSSDTRYTINALLIDHRGDETRFMCTDGHRIAIRKLSVPFKAEPFVALCPRDTMVKLTPLLGKYRKETAYIVVEPTISDDDGTKLGRIEFTFGDIKVQARLVEGTPVKYEQVIPADTGNYLVANRTDLILGLNRVRALTGARSNAVIISMDGTKINLSGSDPDKGEISLDIKGSYSGMGLDAGFNASYIIDALESLECDEVRFQIDGPVCGAKLSDSRTTCVIMTMRVASRGFHDEKHDEESPIAKVKAIVSEDEMREAVEEAATSKAEAEADEVPKSLSVIQKGGMLHLQVTSEDSDKMLKHSLGACLKCGYVQPTRGREAKQCNECGEVAVFWIGELAHMGALDILEEVSNGTEKA